MVGIHTGARMLVEGVDYRVEGREVVFPTPPGAVLDICAGCAWPERFDRTEIQKRRKETRTLNAWDSQYGLEAKPLRSEEHTSELQSLMRISYAVFCLNKKKHEKKNKPTHTQKN